VSRQDHQVAGVIVQEARPSPSLRTVVRGYRERTAEAGGPGFIIPLPGRPAQFLEIYLDAPLLVSLDGGAFSPAAEAVVVGPSSRHRARLFVTGRVATFHIEFEPTGFHRLFGISMPQLVDIATPSDSLGSRVIDDLVSAVRLAPDFAARARAADDWLAHRLARSRPAEAVDNIARLIRRTMGAPSVALLAQRLEISPRQLQRRFNEQVGLPLKLYARTVRFDAVLRAREKRPDISWTELAHCYGYFDQAHLLRDAHSFTGMAPTAFEQESLTMSDPS